MCMRLLAQGSDTSSHITQRWPSRHPVHAQVIGLELYDDEMDGKPRETGVKRTQWLEAGSTQLAGKTILIVDEASCAGLGWAVLYCAVRCGAVRTWCRQCCAVSQQRNDVAERDACCLSLPDVTRFPAPPPMQVDDSRQTLAYAARELLADIAAEEAALAAAGRWGQLQICSPASTIVHGLHHGCRFPAMLLLLLCVRLTACGAHPFVPSAGAPAPPPTRLGCFVIHNKSRVKAAQLPEGVPQIVGQVRYAVPCCALLCHDVDC